MHIWLWIHSGVHSKLGIGLITVPQQITVWVSHVREESRTQGRKYHAYHRNLWWIVMNEQSTQKTINVLWRSHCHHNGSHLYGCIHEAHWWIYTAVSINEIQECNSDLFSWWCFNEPRTALTSTSSFLCSHTRNVSTSWRCNFEYITGFTPVLVGGDHCII